MKNMVKKLMLLSVVVLIITTSSASVFAYTDCGKYKNIYGWEVGIIRYYNASECAELSQWFKDMADDKKYADALKKTSKVIPSKYIQKAIKTGTAIGEFARKELCKAHSKTFSKAAQAKGAKVYLLGTGQITKIEIVY